MRPSDDSSKSKVISDVKSVKKEINELKIKAKAKVKSRDFQDAINIYKNGIKLASNWDLIKIVNEFENSIRLVQIDGLKELKQILEKKAQIAEEKVLYEEAIKNYTKAKEIASEIFKLGVSDMSKDIRKLIKKAKELENDLKMMYKDRY